MIVLYSVGGIIALLLLLAALTGTRWSFERSIHINAPASRVWSHVNTFNAMNQWSPYVGLDPNIRQSITGTDGAVGATYTWDSDMKNVGAGSQTITEINEGSRLASRLAFIRPFKGLAQAEMRLAPEGEGTKATWRIDSRTPYPMNIIKLFGVIEKNMDRDFNKGLSRLKTMSEEQTPNQRYDAFDTPARNT